MKHALSMIAALLLASLAAISAENPNLPLAEICNGALDEFPVRPDTEGIHVGAHHGGIIFAEDKYWWYGQCLSPKPAADRGSATERGVAMYSSGDLVKWRNEGIVLSCRNERELKGPLRFARSKIVFNPHTRKYVLWCHYVGFPGAHGMEVGTGDAGVAVCDAVNGQYQWRGIQRPLGPDMVVRDSTLFQDEDGKAYFIFDTYPKDRSVRRRLYMAELSDDYLSCRHVRPLEGLEVREAPAMFKHNGCYFLITSGVTGWKPNPPRVHRAKHVFGPYTDLGDFCRGDDTGTTFNSQPTFVFELRHKPGTFVFMGDRWNLQNMVGSAHIWLPLKFKSPDHFEMHYQKSWDINLLAAAAKPLPAAQKVIRASSMGFHPTDSTTALQSAINSGARKVIVENMGAPWIVDSIQLTSDQEIVFEKGVVVQAKRGAFQGRGDTLFRASLKTNITLTGHGATLRMWKQDYTSSGGHRHLLSFRSCSGVRVEGLTVADSGGDGIYLGVAQKGVPCSDVLIRDVVCDNNYRQGISVISTRNLLIENCVLKNTGGTPPQAGIDFEPNHASEELVNCVMRNCVSENNGGSGYEFFLRNMRAGSAPISIRIENCRAIGCRNSVRFITNADSRTNAVTGTMEFVNCRLEGGEDGILIGDKPVDGARVRFVNCQVIHAATNRPTTTPIQLSNRSTATEDLGNIHFDNLVVTDPVSRLPMSYQDMSGDGRVRDITGTLIVNGKTHRLTPELVAQWMAVAAFKPIPEFDMTSVRFAPALPDAKPDAGRSGKARVRGPSEWLLWAEAGQEVTFVVHIGRAGKGAPAPVPVTLVAPSGKATKLKRAQGEGETAYQFQAKETGAHQILCDPRKWTATVNSVTHRVCLYAADKRIRFLGTTGEYFFWVPPGTKEFAIRVAGESNTERVKAALRNPDGKTIEEKDNIAAAHQFLGQPTDDSDGEIWSLRLEKSSTGVLDDFQIRFEGVPPVLAHTKASLLKP